MPKITQRQNSVLHISPRFFSGLLAFQEKKYPNSFSPNADLWSPSHSFCCADTPFQ